ncbi:zinc finger protein-related [Raphanus sativus]|nr:zinc finger protein-related [Raphanus sativus]
MSRNHKAAPEYANSKTAVWWDMDTCPVPDGYDAGRVRPSIEGALKELGYYGPVTITAMGNLKEAPPHLLQRLSSTGILVQHAIPDWVATLIFSDVMEFKRNNPPPATIMLISDKVDRELSFRLCRNQQIQRGYNLVRARSFCGNPSRLYHTADWRWKTILEEAADSVSQDTTTSSVLRKCSSSVDSSALSSFVCRACKFTGLSVASFTSHLSTEEHEPYPHLLMNDQAAPEYVYSKTRGGVPSYIYSGLTTSTWLDHPPPATIMVISDEVEKFSLFLSRAQQRSYYNLVLARTYTPQSMSQLYHTAEWLWQTLLARSHETTSCVLRKCTASGASSSSSFLCKTCHFTALSVSDFFSHLSSEEHKRKEILIIKPIPHDDEDSDEESMAKINPKRKRPRRKAFRTTHVLLLNRRPSRRGRP